MALRVLLMADSHLGFDLPVHARVARRRRGHDFLANHAAALRPALTGEADLVVHGGDVFHRPNVPAGLAFQAYRPLLAVAERGIPVFITAGNHERARLPHARLLRHRNIHVFDVPRTFTADVAGVRVSLAGFPFERRVRARFPDLLERTRWRDAGADVRLLVMHQCFEGATVGPGNFTFTTADDVVRAQDVPPGFDAVLSGHIHRQQVLMHDLRGGTLRAPMIYPGSIERTATAEIGEAKGTMLLRFDGSDAPAWEVLPLPARPMLLHRISAGDEAGTVLDSSLRQLVAAAPADAVLCIRVEGPVNGAHLRLVSSAHLRTFVPATMNVEVRVPEAMQPQRRQQSAGAHAQHSVARSVNDENLCLDL